MQLLPYIHYHILDSFSSLKTRERKKRDWKTRHHTARVENAGLENPTPYCKGGKRRTGKRGTALQGLEYARLKTREWQSMESSTQLNDVNANEFRFRSNDKSLLQRQCNAVEHSGTCASSIPASRRRLIIKMVFHTFAFLTVPRFAFSRFQSSLFLLANRMFILQ